MTDQPPYEPVPNSMVPADQQPSYDSDDPGVTIIPIPVMVPRERPYPETPPIPEAARERNDTTAPGAVLYGQ